MKLLQTIKCDCGDTHNIYDFDVKAEFHCLCGRPVKPTDNVDISDEGFDALINSTRYETAR